MWWNPGRDVKTEMTKQDRSILHELAEQVAAIAADPVHQQNAELWTRHNDLQRTRPLVLVYPEGAWREMMPADSVLECETRFARMLEHDLRTRIYYWAHLRDDNPIEATLDVPMCGWVTGFGLSEEKTYSDQSTGAHHFDSVIHSMADIEAMTEPELVVDWDESIRRLEVAQEAFGEVLDVRLGGCYRGSVAPIDEYGKLRGLDTLFYDMIDQPEMVHEFSRRYVDGYIKVAREMEAEGVLKLGLRGHYAGSGGTCFTNGLPANGFDGTHVRTRDQWGFATTQIFSEVSPAMHEEFALAHEKRFLELYGLNCYGCCEPLHDKLDLLFKHIPRLRRISISPWADIEKSAEKLQDRYIYSWKPNPAILAGEAFDPDVVRTMTREFCEKTRGCITEIIMKDTHTVRNEPQRMWDWVRVTKEVAEGC